MAGFAEKSEKGRRGHGNKISWPFLLCDFVLY